MNLKFKSVSLNNQTLSAAIDQLIILPDGFFTLSDRPDFVLPKPPGRSPRAMADATELFGMRKK